MRSDDSQDEDPSGYLALVPVLLWTAQPDLTRQETDRLNQAIPGLLAKLRKGLKTINYPALQTSAFLQRLVALHQAAFEKPVSSPKGQPEVVVTDQTVDAAGLTESPALSASAPLDSAQAPVDAPDPYADFVIGVWVELVTNGRVVRTQLTWSSPHGTLFLFTAPDASTQSMTRRMRDKLAAEGSLRVVPAQPNKPAKPVVGAPGAIDLASAERVPSKGRSGSASNMAPLSGPKSSKNR